VNSAQLHQNANSKLS